MAQLTEKQRLPILITFGGTEEPIDGVRFLTNFSTGSTGAFIYEYLQKRSLKVYCLHSNRCCFSSCATQNETFSDFRSLNSQLERILGERKFAAVIHLAAVSDFSIDFIQIGEKRFAPASATKIDSDSADKISLHLKRNFKIIDFLKNYSANKEICVFGFKLTNCASESERIKAVEKMFSHSSADFVVQNDLSEMSNTRHCAKIYSRKELIKSITTKEELAHGIFEILSGDIGEKK
ncbi:MAG: hypothetical protein HQM08_21490 [Candidatus Riflebacteria bacterium]|nr:hypothetical protein [Candidatus Riflebacteria bacterium]